MSKVKVEKEFGLLIGGGTTIELGIVPEPKNKAIILIGSKIEKGIVIKFIPKNSTSAVVKEYDVELNDVTFDGLLSEIITTIERFVGERVEIRRTFSESEGFGGDGNMPGGAV